MVLVDSPTAFFSNLLAESAASCREEMGCCFDAPLMRRGFHSTTMCEVAACGIRGIFFEASQRLRSVAVPRIHDERDLRGRVDILVLQPEATDVS